MNRYRVLMTKKISSELCKFANEKGLELTEVEFLDVVPCEENDKVKEVAARQTAVAFTSKNAVNAVSSLMEGSKPNWKIFCIDGATRDQVAECFGEQSITGTANHAESLASLIIEKTADKEIVFFCGDRRRDELPDTLSDNDIEVEEVVVYETRLSPEEIGEHFDGIAFFSPSAVESYFTVNVMDDITICYSIGPTTTACLQKFTKNKIITCGKASEESMVNTILGSIKSNNE